MKSKIYIYIAILIALTRQTKHNVSIAPLASIRKSPLHRSYYHLEISNR